MLKSKGQSLSEYSVVIALACIAGIGGLLLLGQNVNSIFRGMIQDKDGVQVGVSASTLHADKASAVFPPELGNTSPSPGNNYNTSVSIASSTNDAKAVQTAGSMGDSKNIYANTDAILEFAEKFRGNPKIYNAIIKLAQKGKEMAQALATYESSQKENDYLMVERLWNQFTDIWLAEVYGSPVFQHLSASDQTYLRSLTSESARIAYYADGSTGSFTIAGLDDGTGSTAANPATGSANTIDNNSDITMECADGQCR